MRYLCTENNWTTETTSMLTILHIPRAWSRDNCYLLISRRNPYWIKCSPLINPAFVMVIMFSLELQNNNYEHLQTFNDLCMLCEYLVLINVFVIFKSRDYLTKEFQAGHLPAEYLNFFVCLNSCFFCSLLVSAVLCWVDSVDGIVFPAVWFTQGYCVYPEQDLWFSDWFSDSCLLPHYQGLSEGGKVGVSKCIHSEHDGRCGNTKGTLINIT